MGIDRDNLSAINCYRLFIVIAQNRFGLSNTDIVL